MIRITSMLKETIISASRILIYIIPVFLSWQSAVLAERHAGIDEIYQPYAELLDSYHIKGTADKNSGLVTAFDYKEALKDPETKQIIREQKNNLKTFDTESLKSKERALSFWINAYNFFMIAHILDNPKQDGDLIDSVKDYGNFINPYKVFDKAKFNIGGKQYSLSTIEKEILLGKKYQNKGWKDARVHFAVNCASVGCPPLRQTIYTPDNINSLLTQNTRLALQTSRHLRIEGDTLYLTELFDWYKNDFVEDAGSIRSFIKQYTYKERHDAIEDATSIRYIDYDWALNRPSNFSDITRRTTSRQRQDDKG